MLAVVEESVEKFNEEHDDTGKNMVMLVTSLKEIAAKDEASVEVFTFGEKVFTQVYTKGCLEQRDGD